MPAAAVIPAPIAYIKVVAVKKLVVGSREPSGGPPRGGLTAASRLSPRRHSFGALHCSCRRRSERLL